MFYHKTLAFEATESRSAEEANPQTPSSYATDNTLYKALRASCTLKTPRKMALWRRKGPIARLEYNKHAQRKFKKEFRQVKWASWRIFCENIENPIKAARLRTAGEISFHSCTFMKREGEWATYSHETLEMLFSTHFQGCVDVNRMTVHERRGMKKEQKL